jgi:hypothetical protein
VLAAPARPPALRQARYDNVDSPQSTTPAQSAGVVVTRTSYEELSLSPARDQRRPARCRSG